MRFCVFKMGFFSQNFQRECFYKKILNLKLNFKTKMLDFLFVQNRIFIILNFTQNLFISIFYFIFFFSNYLKLSNQITYYTRLQSCTCIYIFNFELIHFFQSNLTPLVWIACRAISTFMRKIQVFQIKCICQDEITSS